LLKAKQVFPCPLGRVLQRHSWAGRIRSRHRPCGVGADRRNRTCNSRAPDRKNATARHRLIQFRAWFVTRHALLRSTFLRPSRGEPTGGKRKNKRRIPKQKEWKARISQRDSCERLVAVENEREVVFVAVGIIAVDFHDFRNEASAGTAFQVHYNIHAIAHIGFYRANAKVSPDTTMATRERPRAIVLVNACCRTLTAFSHGELL
jgi:hypothetical protein